LWSDPLDLNWNPVFKPMNLSVDFDWPRLRDSKVQCERGFFLHLNAEVIFYGGTHPDATVYVNGQEVALLPDGSFRYHFTLPDGDFEIPIVAVSPDGLEERSGTLSFQRQTKRVGVVGATVQPEYLEPLMGRRRA